MENASKALTMAAGVLIGVLIISLAVYLFIDFGTTSAKINSQVTEQQVSQFNSKFTSYEGQEGLTIYDVITVASYAYENNVYYENLDEYKIKVYLGSEEIQDTINENDNYKGKITLIQMDKSFINAGNLKLPTYKCKVLSYHSSGRIHEIKFSKNTP